MNVTLKICCCCLQTKFDPIDWIGFSGCLVGTGTVVGMLGGVCPPRIFQAPHLNCVLIFRRRTPSAKTARFFEGAPAAWICL